MSDEQPSDEEIIQAIYAFAADRMANGDSEAEIRRQLVEKGLDDESAATIVKNLSEVQADAKAEAAKKNMVFGALWCIGGIVITAATYSAASEGGGTYVVAWGAILFGAIQFFQGVAQSN